MNWHPLSEHNEPSSVPLDKFLTNDRFLEGGCYRWFIVVSLKMSNRDNRCSLKIELCNSRNPQTLFLLEDGV